MIPRVVRLRGHVAQVFAPEAFAFARWLLVFAGACTFAACLAPAAHAGNLILSPDAIHTLDQIYSGNPDAAIATARTIEQMQPESPVGFLLEAEAMWWKMYCAACEIKWGMLDAWKRGKKPEDDAYLALADKAIDLARAQIAKSDTAEPHVYVAV